MNNNEFWKLTSSKYLFIYLFIYFFDSKTCTYSYNNL